MNFSNSNSSVSSTVQAATSSYNYFESFFAELIKYYLRILMMSLPRKYYLN